MKARAPGSATITTEHRIRDAVSNPKYVDPKGQMVAVARSLGVSFGDGR